MFPPDSNLAHERGTLEAATEARSRALAAGANLAARIPAETMLTGAIQRIAVTVERYPELRASQNMQLLQEQLTSTENRIAFAREFYSESVMRLNTAIATFPRNLIAGMMGVGPATLFVADEGTTDDRVIGNRGIENRKLSAAWWSKGRFCGEKSNDRNGTNTNYRVPNTRHRSPNTRPLPPQEKPGLIVLTSSMKTWLCSVLAVEAITLTGNIPRVAVDPAAIVMPN